MQLLPQSLNQALNKGYLKQSVTRDEINAFKANLVRMFARIDEDESEENLKNIVSDFLKDTYYSPLSPHLGQGRGGYEINTKDRKDLVIHHGKTSKDPVGLILEAKKPANKAEMMTLQNPNKKALQELVLYYLKETYEKNNHEIKYLVVTNIWEWYILDGIWFEKHIFKNYELKKAFETWKVSGQSTQFFYDNIAKVLLEKIEDDLPCTYFNLKDFRSLVEAPECEEDNELISLYKIFSPEHLLRKPFANDSNTLNTAFYFELLYILGLEEVKEGAKKVIQRAKNQQVGSFFENTLQELKSRKRLLLVPNVKQYGENEEEQLFSIALELCITWLNRILFLKLLEGQLIKYRKDNTFFLHFDYLKDFDEVNELFFDVLAVPVSERTATANVKFQQLPYLNSSLFDETELEMHALSITGLKNRLEMPILPQTALKDGKGNLIKGKKNTLQYLFEFLSSYDFAGESGVKIQAESKSIINAAVLGLIFEKINGYKDGSFFTPGYITMYMCRETIRKAVVQKFNEKYNWKCEHFAQLKDKIGFYDIKVRQEANELINSLKICDPSVGSGHFLVSALNEIIVIKRELQILCDKEGNRIREYTITVENDEIIISDFETSALFAYRLNQNNMAIPPLQLLQEAIFNEKKTIIENCLFGVDINPKSVAICRLRLWIELLKNMYYTKESNYTELETLPNIDINIKTGNSLISRFSLGNGQNLLPKDRLFVKKLIDDYKIQVFAYKSVKNSRAKQAIRKQIAHIKTELEKFSIPNDKEYEAFRKKEAELGQITFVFDANEKDKQLKLAGEVSFLRQKYVEKLQTLYRNTLEWRFDFPEVLDDEGHFEGFDVVLANPPYGVSFSKAETDYLKTQYQSFEYQANSYVLFYEIALQILKDKGFFHYITPATFTYQPYFSKIREILAQENRVVSARKYVFEVFKEASIGDCISFSVQKTAEKQDIDIIISPSAVEIGEKQRVSLEKFLLQDGTFSLNGETIELKKMENNTSLLGKLATIIVGIKAYQVGKGQPKQTQDIVDKKVFTSKIGLDKSYLPCIIGRDFHRYTFLNQDFMYLKYGEWLAEMRASAPFFETKIIVRQTSDEIIAHLDETKSINLNNVYNIGKIQSNFEIKYILALLNSKLFTFIYQHISQEKGRTFAEVKKVYLEKLPIKNLPHEAQKPFVSAVDSILKTSKQQKEVTEMLAKLDKLVYELYEITAEEIAIIEGKI